MAIFRWKVVLFLPTRGKRENFCLPITPLVIILGDISRMFQVEEMLAHG